MIKIVSLFALMGMAAAAPGAVTYGGPAYAAAPAYAQAPLGYAAQAYAPAVAKYAAPLAYAQPIAKAIVAQPEPYDAHPQYNYGYSVSDALTGDSKTATESRDGDVVQGQYSLVEPDGAIRTVTYTADPIHGFNAVVDRQAPAVVKKVVAAPVAVKAFGAPAYAGYAHGPVGYAAGPVGYAAHGHPVAHY